MTRADFSAAPSPSGDPARPALSNSENGRSDRTTTDLGERGTSVEARSSIDSSASRFDQPSLFVEQPAVEAPARRCRWCLGPLASSSPRSMFCSDPCKARHWSRAKYAPNDADGYGARLAAARPCEACGAVFTAPPMQGAHPRRFCTSCRPQSRDRRSAAPS